MIIKNILTYKGREQNVNYGYARVSSKSQNEDRQIEDLLKQRILITNIYLDKQSGKNFDRPQYKKMLRKLRAGDTVFVKSIDRFGRNYDEVIQQWYYLTKKKKVEIVVLDMPLLDTRRSKDLLGEFITDIVLQILSYVAQAQREDIRQSQADGIRLAQEKGIKFGRPKAISKEYFLSLYRQVELGKIKRKEACEQAGISTATFRRYEKEYIG